MTHAFTYSHFSNGPPRDRRLEITHRPPMLISSWRFLKGSVLFLIFYYWYFKTSSAKLSSSGNHVLCRSRVSILNPRKFRLTIIRTIFFFKELFLQRSSSLKKSFSACVVIQPVKRSNQLGPFVPRIAALPTAPPEKPEPTYYWGHPGVTLVSEVTPARPQVFFLFITFQKSNKQFSISETTKNKPI